MASSKKGTVYVLTNPSFTGMVKIGYTTRTAEKRAKELSGTSTPTPFQVFYESPLIDSPRELERSVHKKFANDRITNGREFFAITPQQAKDAIVEALPTQEEKKTHTIHVDIPQGVEDIILKLKRI